MLISSILCLEPDESDPNKQVVGTLFHGAKGNQIKDIETTTHLEGIPRLFHEFFAFY